MENNNQLDVLFTLFRDKVSHHNRMFKDYLAQNKTEKAFEQLGMAGAYIDAAQAVLDIQKAEFESKLSHSQ
jgi:hypothetical protein